MTVIVSPTGAEAAGQLAERIFVLALATFDIACMHFSGPPARAVRRAEHERAAHRGRGRRTCWHEERYTREWLEQQAATGIVACMDPSAKPLELLLLDRATPSRSATPRTSPTSAASRASRSARCPRSIS